MADAAGRAVATDLGGGKLAGKRIREFVGLLSARIPWVLAGYSDELKNLYETNLRDFVAAVADRKREAESLRS